MKTPPPETTKARLVADAATGDADSWEELVRRFTPFLQRVARSYGLDEATVADIVQTTWLRAVEQLHTLRDPEAIGMWLTTTARRESATVLRKRRRERLIGCYDFVDGPDDQRSPDEEVADRDQHARLRAAMVHLPARDRRLLGLLMDSRTPGYTAVSAALNMPVGSIGPIRARSLAQLRRELTRCDVVPARSLSGGG